MIIADVYSHLNGEEFLLVRRKAAYREIREVVSAINVDACRTKISRERTMSGKRLISPKELNAQFKTHFRARDWLEQTYRYYLATDRRLLEQVVSLPFEQQRVRLLELGASDPLWSKKQTDFVKDGIAVEVQFGKYAFVAYDLFVKHLLFYSGSVIDVGVEILPVKGMLRDVRGGRSMSTGIAYFECEVYNLLRHGRGSPPVPLVILGVAP